MSQNNTIKIPKETYKIIPSHLKGKNIFILFPDFTNCEIYSDEYFSCIKKRKKAMYYARVNKEDSIRAIDYFKYSRYYNENRLRITTAPIAHLTGLNIQTNSVAQITNKKITTICGHIGKHQLNKFELIDSFNLNHNFVKPNLLLNERFIVVYKSDSGLLYFKNIKNKSNDSLNIKNILNKLSEKMSINYLDKILLEKVRKVRDTLNQLGIEMFSLNPNSFILRNDTLRFTSFIKLLYLDKDTVKSLNRPIFVEINLSNKRYNSKSIKVDYYFNYMYPELVNSLDGYSFGVRMRSIENSKCVFLKDSFVYTLASFEKNDDSIIAISPMLVNIGKQEYMAITGNQVYSTNVWQIGKSHVLFAFSNKLFTLLNSNEGILTLPVKLSIDSGMISFILKYDTIYYLSFIDFSKNQTTILKTTNFITYSISESFNYSTGTFIQYLDNKEIGYFTSNYNDNIYIYKKVIIFRKL